jgi:hypothetical protein
MLAEFAANDNKTILAVELERVHLQTSARRFHKIFRRA